MYYAYIRVKLLIELMPFDRKVFIKTAACFTNNWTDFNRRWKTKKWTQFAVQTRSPISYANAVFDWHLNINGTQCIMHLPPILVFSSPCPALQCSETSRNFNTKTRLFGTLIFRMQNITVEVRDDGTKQSGYEIRV